MALLLVHHLSDSRSQRLLWLLEELQLEYEIVRYQRDPATLLAPPALEAVHPLGKSPVVEHAGRVVAESGAIVEYLVELAGGRLRPTEPESLLRYRCFLHYAEASLMPPLLVALISSRVRQAPMPFFVRPVAERIGGQISRGFVEPNLRKHMAFLESELVERGFFVGEELCAADTQMLFPLQAAQARGTLGDAHPKLRDFIRRAEARPAYRRALQRGGPFSLLR